MTRGVMALKKILILFFTSYIYFKIIFIYYYFIYIIFNKIFYFITYFIYIYLLYKK